MEDKEYIPPSDQDLLLSDVKEDDLRSGVSLALEETYLDVVSEEPSWPVKGILFGHNSRPFVCFYVKIKTKSIKVFFLVDTGSPHTYLSGSTMNALGVDSVPSSFRSTIHGVFMPATYISPSNSHYSDINIIGADFLNRGQFQLQLDYGSATLTLHPS